MSTGHRQLSRCQRQVLIPMATNGDVSGYASMLDLHTVLWKDEVIRHDPIADLLAIPASRRASLSRLLRRLEQRGLVQRVGAPMPGARLSELGRRWANQAPIVAVQTAVGGSKRC